MHGTTIAVDLAKAVFEVALSEHPGQGRERRRLTRAQFQRSSPSSRPRAW